MKEEIHEIMINAFTVAAILAGIVFCGFMVVMLSESLSPDILVTDVATMPICVNKVLEGERGGVHIIASDGVGYYIHTSRQNLNDVFLIAHEGDTCQITYVIQWPWSTKSIVSASCNTKSTTCE
jgi:hypothetical protein